MLVSSLVSSSCVFDETIGFDLKKLKKLLLTVTVTVTVTATVTVTLTVTVTVTVTNTEFRKLALTLLLQKSFLYDTCQEITRTPSNKNNFSYQVAPCTYMIQHEYKETETEFDVTKAKLR